MSTPLIIRTRDLTRRFGTFTAVDALSIEVQRGWIFAFLGANGSGKSTTIRMLIGLLAPTSGEIVVDGVDVLRQPRRVRDRIGYMGQKVSLYQGLTIRENVEFYAGLFGLDGDALERRWGGLRERFDLRDAERERSEDLPAALRQRAGLALATLHGPRLLFLDEPTAGVDVQSRAAFWELIREQADAGVTVFVTTHFLEEADLCDWVSFIDAGRLVANSPPAELRARYSAGYRIRVDVPSDRVEHVRSALVAGGLAPSLEPTVAGFLTIECRTLGPGATNLLARIAVETPAVRVHVEQVEMADVFRAVIRGGSCGGAG